MCADILSFHLRFQGDDDNLLLYNLKPVLLDSISHTAVNGTDAGLWFLSIVSKRWLLSNVGYPVSPRLPLLLCTSRPSCGFAEEQLGTDSDA